MSFIKKPLFPIILFFLSFFFSSQSSYSGYSGTLISLLSFIESKLWMIPVEFSTADAPQDIAHAHMMCAKEAVVYIEGIKATDWIKLNPGAFGFYRVQYSPEMLQMFKSSISDCSLPPIDRLGLLDDLFALVRIFFTCFHFIFWTY